MNENSKNKNDATLKYFSYSKHYTLSVVVVLNWLAVKLRLILVFVLLLSTVGYQIYETM